MEASVTSLYAGLTGLLFLVLSYRVVKNRVRAKVGLGAGEDPGLERAIRVQGNLAEYAPIVLVLMLVTESVGGSPWLLHTTGSLFLLARIFHAIGLSSRSGPSGGRKVGTAATWLVLLVLSLAAIAYGL
ncbi:MAG: MAPEG family protein [Gammaproteobacteria bacterium]|jgi:uncharacterized membrane protein YecN with MAPEG domain|nr:MAG: MAPEG family protein [Gammaproteobacteria bacterium]